MVVGKPDVILLDVRLPGEDGLETRRISEQHPDIGVIILTAYDDPKYVTEAVMAGARAYVLKTAGGDPGDLAVGRARPRGDRLMGVEGPGRGEQGKRAPGTHEARARRAAAAGQGLHEPPDWRGAGDLQPDVKTHIQHILNRLGVTDRTDAVAKALRARIIE